MNPKNTRFYPILSSVISEKYTTKMDGPSLPYELIAEGEYDHVEYCRQEYRDVQALMEASRRNIAAYERYFSEDYDNKSYMDLMMARFHRIEYRVDHWLPYGVVPENDHRTVEEVDRAKLKCLKYLAQKLISRMAPALEAYNMAPPKGSAWCAPKSLPPLRQIKPHKPLDCVRATVNRHREDLQNNAVRNHQLQVDRDNLQAQVLNLQNQLRQMTSQVEAQANQLAEKNAQMVEKNLTILEKNIQLETLRAQFEELNLN